MRMKMSRVPVDRVFLDRRGPTVTGECEFTVDCGSVYFGAVYAGDGNLLTVDQYFYSEEFSHDDMEEAIAGEDLIYVDDRDFPVKTYLLAKEEGGEEWLRFHAVVPGAVDPDYYRQKYINMPISP